MFPHRNIHKTLGFSDWKVHNQTDHILTYKRRHLNLGDVLFLRGANCDSEYYLADAKVRQRLSVSKRAAQV